MSTSEPRDRAQAAAAQDQAGDDAPVFLTERPDDPENWQQVVDLRSDAPLKSYWRRAEDEGMTAPGRGHNQQLSPSGAAIILTTAAEVAKRDALLKRVQADLKHRKARNAS